MYFNERNLWALNNLFQEFTANRIRHDEQAIANLISSIVSNLPFKQIKLIRLQKHVLINAKHCPIKIVLSTPNDTFKI